MANLRDITSELEQLESLLTLTEAYQEIAASRMRKTRAQVLQSRDFQTGLKGVFMHLKSSYKSKIAKLIAKKARKVKALPGQGQNQPQVNTAHVLISANTGFYGDIVNNTYRLFMTTLAKEKGLPIIIGKKGLTVFQGETGRVPSAYFDFPDHKFDIPEFTKLITHLASYERIFVYYGKFESLISQVPTISSISGDEVLGQEATASNAPVFEYTFEPSLEKLMDFFKGEIFTSIFEQTIYESQLAKFAARMLSLDLAIEQARLSLKKTSFEKERAIRRVKNSKQLAALSGMSLWG